MPAKRLTGGQYYIEVKVADNVTARYTYDDKESYEKAFEDIVISGDKVITDCGEF